MILVNAYIYNKCYFINERILIYMKQYIDATNLLNKWNELSPRGRTEFDQIIMTEPVAFDTEKVTNELQTVFEQIVAEILYKTESDFTIADFNIKPFSNRICDVIRNIEITNHLDISYDKNEDFIDEK